MIDVKNIFINQILAESDPLGYDVGAYKGIRIWVYDVQTVDGHDVYARPKHAAHLSPAGDVLVNKRS